MRSLDITGLARPIQQILRHQHIEMLHTHFEGLSAGPDKSTNAYFCIDWLYPVSAAES